LHCLHKPCCPSGQKRTQWTADHGFPWVQALLGLPPLSILLMLRAVPCRLLQAAFVWQKRGCHFGHSKPRGGEDGRTWQRDLERDTLVPSYCKGGEVGGLSLGEPVTADLSLGQLDDKEHAHVCTHGGMQALAHSARTHKHMRRLQLQFWQPSQWLDVVIDDRLPTFRDRLVFLHSADRSELWRPCWRKPMLTVARLSCRPHRLNGSYEALKGGSAIEAMEDFTGGVAETFTTKETPGNFYEILDKALKRGSLVGCSIDIRNAAESEARTPSGLIRGHAYTVTGIDQVNFRGQKIELIRVRNPWGQVEWTRSWSDSGIPLAQPSKSACVTLLWTMGSSGTVSERTDRPRHNHHPPRAASPLGGRMAFGDFQAHFDKVEVCNLTPDALEGDTVPKWEVAVPQGSWVRGATAGGCRSFLDTFWTNPQIKLSLTEKDEGQEKCTFLVALMQKDRRKLKRFGASMLTIGYAIYQCPGQDGHLNKDFFRHHASQARSKTSINLREVSDRFSLPPGAYTVIPSTFEPHQAADFCLRIFLEKKAITRDMDGTVDIDLPECKFLWLIFSHQSRLRLARRQRRNGSSGPYLNKSLDAEVTAEELEYGLNAVLQKKKDIKFKKLSLTSCKNIISLMDTSGNGKLAFGEFRVFWDKLKKTFSFSLMLTHLAPCFQFSTPLLQLVVLRYADQELQLGFDDFLNCLVGLETASQACKEQAAENRSEGGLSHTPCHLCAVCG
ncbi:hypothetical protein E2I00_018221, partial [Balaenoptera physalus]